VRLLASPQFPELKGMSFPEIAALRGGDEWDAYFDILAAAGAEMPKLIMYGELYSEEHLAAMVSHPLFMLAVDAMNSTIDPPLAAMTGQPLVYAGQITYLTHHVLETGLLRLEEAVRKMTSMPAAHFGLRGRGLLQAGCAADVVILDLDRLRAPSTVLDPARYAEGVDHVLVNGSPVLEDGTHTGSRPGRTLRRS
jgi:N-acyl-D-amino-acid deacylase